MSKVVMAAIVCCLGVVDLAQAQITVQLPDASQGPIHWILGIDGSYSVPSDEFREYSAIFRESVLTRVREGDVMTIFRLDQPRGTGPEKPINVTFDRRSSRFQKQLSDLACEVGALRQRGIKPPHDTDFGRGFAHIREAQLLDRNREYRLVLVTDGFPDGSQTRWNGSFPLKGRWKMLVVGIHDKAQERFLTLADEFGFHSGDLTRLVPFNHWRTTGIYDEALGRRPYSSALQALRKSNCSN